MSTAELKDTARKENRKNVKRQSLLSNLTIRGERVFVDGGFDIIYLFLVLALLTTGLIMMASASYVWGEFHDGDPYHYVKRQLVFAVIGIVVMFILSKVNPQFIKKFAVLISAVGLFLLVAVLFYHVEVPENPDIKRWMFIPGTSFTFQPSDVGKLAMIIGLSWGLEKGKKLLDQNMFAPLIYFGIVGVVSILIFAESHLSCFVMMFMMGVGILFLSGIDRRWFIFFIIVALVLGGLLLLTYDKILSPYQVERLTSFTNKDYTDTDTRWQTNQSLFALGSGGLFGLGLGNSRQKFLYIPEPHNDFIFAIVGEELGFFRSAVIILMFLALVARGFIIAARTKSMYERLVVLGVSLQVGIQSVLNILVVTDMMPNTGISLPFFSYGGTALLILMAEMGLVLGVSRSGSRVARKIRGESNAE